MNRPGRTIVSLIAAVIAAAICTAPIHPAAAAWGLSGSGAGAGAATTMPTGKVPTSRAGGSTVTIVWNAATFGNGTPVAGYVIQRINAVNGSPAPAGGSCAGVVTTTSCSETAPSGTWVYTDTPVQNNWTGGTSPASNSVTV